MQSGTVAQKREEKKGLYPELTFLGVVAHHTPLAASEIAQLTTALSSLAEAVRILAQRGRNIDIKILRNLTYFFANKARSAQQTLPPSCAEHAIGKRCAVSVDGGRIRIRTNKKGKKTPKNRSRFNADWREPKLLHIWMLEADGSIFREFCPWIDGTLSGADAIFMLLRYYLSALQVTKASQILFIADGASWIWNRIPALIESLGIDQQKVYQIVDFFHAVEHLNTAHCTSRKGFSLYKGAKNRFNLLSI